MKYISSLRFTAAEMLWRGRFPYRKHITKNRAIFIHIPKCAGTSVLKALGKRAGGREHLPWYVYAGASPNQYKQYFKFSFVRNPWSRVYSAYSYFARGGNQSGDLLMLKRMKRYNSFEDFLLTGLGEGELSSHVFFQSQSSFLVNGDGELAVDFLGRFENIADDFRAIAEKLNLPSKELPALNVGNKQDDRGLRGVYNDRMIDFVGSYYKEDVRRFNYKFPD
jgi:hypothetical protein